MNVLLTSNELNSMPHFGFLHRVPLVPLSNPHFEHFLIPRIVGLPKSPRKLASRLVPGPGFPSGLSCSIISGLNIIFVFLRHRIEGLYQKQYHYQCRQLVFLTVNSGSSEEFDQQRPCCLDPPV